MISRSNFDRRLRDFFFKIPETVKIIKFQKAFRILNLVEMKPFVVISLTLSMMLQTLHVEKMI